MANDKREETKNVDSQNLLDEDLFNLSSIGALKEEIIPDLDGMEARAEEAEEQSEEVPEEEVVALNEEGKKDSDAQSGESPDQNQQQNAEANPQNAEAQAKDADQDLDADALKKRRQDSDDEAPPQVQTVTPEAEGAIPFQVQDLGVEDVVVESAIEDDGSATPFSVDHGAYSQPGSEERQLDIDTKVSEVPFDFQPDIIPPESEAPVKTLISDLRFFVNQANIDANDVGEYCIFIGSEDFITNLTQYQNDTDDDGNFFIILPEIPDVQGQPSGEYTPIVFDSVDPYFNDGDADIDIFSGTNLTIKGESCDVAVIDGAFISRIFDVQPAANFALEDLTLTRGDAKDEQGGALRNVEGFVSLDSVCVVDNRAYEGGGVASVGIEALIPGIFEGIPELDGSYLPVLNLLTVTEITDSLFDGNIAMNGGGIANYTLTNVDSTLFFNNQAVSMTDEPSYGGAIQNSGYGLLNFNFADDSLFLQNTADNGGGIANLWAASIGYDGIMEGPGLASVDFVENHANQQGGALFNASVVSLEVIDVYFRDNTSDMDGGAIANVGNMGVIRESVFDGNRTLNNGEVDEGPTKDGGAIYNSGFIDSIYDNDIYDSEAEIGGAIHNDGAGIINSISENDIINNMAEFGGGISNEGQILSVEFNNISNNVASESGGGLSNFGTITVIDDAEFIFNEANSGGGIYNTGIIASITGSALFGSNHAETDGGAIHNLSAIFNITDTEFKLNSAGVNGGAIANEGFIDLIGNEVQVVSNTAQSDGGGLWNSGLINGIIGNGSRFYDNDAERGGAIFNQLLGEITTLDSFVINGNHAATYGGGIYNEGFLGSLTNVLIGGALDNGNRIDENTAMEGGGIYNTGTVNLIGQDTSIQFNTAVDAGGGVYNSGFINQFQSSSIHNNILVTYDDDLMMDVRTENSTGGGIFNAESGVITTVDDTNIQENDAYFGGGIYNDGVMENITGSDISSNTAHDGGGLYNSGSVDLIDETLIEDNVADNQGGGIFNALDGTITTISNSEINSNDSNEGGGIYNRSIINDIVDTSISRNTADFGGGLYNSLGIISEINGGDIFDNMANEDGGGIYNTGTINFMQFFDFVNNQADHRGGAIFNENTGFLQYLNDTDFVTNSAKYGGGLYNLGMVGMADADFANGLISGFHELALNYYDEIAYFYDEMGLFEVDFVENTAEAGGAIYNNDTGDIQQIADSSFEGNSSTEGGGGAIYNNAEIFAITTTEFIENTASGEQFPSEPLEEQEDHDPFGGAIYNARSGDLAILADVLFESNVSPLDGGAIYNLGHMFAISQALFENNQAAFEVEETSGRGGHAIANVSSGGNTAAVNGIDYILNSTFYQNGNNSVPGSVIDLGVFTQGRVYADGFVVRNVTTGQSVDLADVVSGMTLDITDLDNNSVFVTETDLLTSFATALEGIGLTLFQTGGPGTNILIYDTDLNQIAVKAQYANQASFTNIDMSHTNSVDLGAFLPNRDVSDTVNTGFTSGDIFDLLLNNNFVNGVTSVVSDDDVQFGIIPSPTIMGDIVTGNITISREVDNGWEADFYIEGIHIGLDDADNITTSGGIANFINSELDVAGVDYVRASNIGGSVVLTHVYGGQFDFSTAFEGVLAGSHFVEITESTDPTFPTVFNGDGSFSFYYNTNPANIGGIANQDPAFSLYNQNVNNFGTFVQNATSDTLTSTESVIENITYGGAILNTSTFEFYALLNQQDASIGEITFSTFLENGATQGAAIYNRNFDITPTQFASTIGSINNSVFQDNNFSTTPAIDGHVGGIYTLAYNQFDAEQGLIPGGLADSIDLFTGNTEIFLNVMNSLADNGGFTDTSLPILYPLLADAYIEANFIEALNLPYGPVIDLANPLLSALFMVDSSQNFYSDGNIFTDIDQRGESRPYDFGAAAISPSTSDEVTLTNFNPGVIMSYTGNQFLINGTPIQGAFTTLTELAALIEAAVPTVGVTVSGNNLTLTAPPAELLTISSDGKTNNDLEGDNPFFDNFNPNTITKILLDGFDPGNGTLTGNDIVISTDGINSYNITGTNINNVVDFANIVVATVPGIETLIQGESLILTYPGDLLIIGNSNEVGEDEDDPEKPTFDNFDINSLVYPASITVSASEIDPIIAVSVMQDTNWDRGAVEVLAADDVDVEVPIVLDLDGDGIELISPQHSAVTVQDENGIHKLGWVSGDDALLVYDLNQDGIVNSLNEIALANYHEDAMTDLQGLKLAFDSNDDNVFDHMDESFAHFGVWQDINENGVTEEGEFKTLVEAGVESIDLSGVESGVVFEEINGNYSFGYGTFVMDGEEHIFGDIGLTLEAVTDAAADGDLFAQDAMNDSTACDDCMDLSSPMVTFTMDEVLSTQQDVV